MLKNVERFAGILPFRYRQAQIEVERAEPPPRIVRARYTLTIAPASPPTSSTTPKTMADRGPLESLFAFHGHRCWASTAGVRAGSLPGGRPGWPNGGLINLWRRTPAMDR